MKTTIESCLSSSIHRYIELKQALGRHFVTETRLLELLDAFMVRTGAADLTEVEFEDWCRTQAHLSPTVRRNAMRIVRNFCLYHRRTDPYCLVQTGVCFQPHTRPFSRISSPRRRSRACCRPPRWCRLQHVTCCAHRYCALPWSCSTPPDYGVGSCCV